MVVALWCYEWYKWMGWDTSQCFTNKKLAKNRSKPRYVNKTNEMQQKITATSNHQTKGTMIANEVQSSHRSINDHSLYFTILLYMETHLLLKSGRKPSIIDMCIRIWGHKVWTCLLLISYERKILQSQILLIWFHKWHCCIRLWESILLSRKKTFPYWHVSASGFTLQPNDTISTDSHKIISSW